MFHEEQYEQILISCLEELREVPISFHGTYYDTEHSAPSHKQEYKKSMKYYDKVVKYAKELKSNYIVFHYNNCEIIANEKQKRLQVAKENLRKMKEIAEEQGLILVVENTGVPSRRNVLLDEEEFIEDALKLDHTILIDIRSEVRRVGTGG